MIERTRNPSALSEHAPWVDGGLWDFAALAKYLGVSVRQAQRVAKLPGFPVVVLGPRSFRFHPDRVREWSYRSDTLERVGVGKNRSRSTTR